MTMDNVNETSLHGSMSIDLLSLDCLLELGVPLFSRYFSVSYAVAVVARKVRRKCPLQLRRLHRFLHHRIMLLSMGLGLRRGIISTNGWGMMHDGRSSLGNIHIVHKQTSFIFNFCDPFSFRLHFPFMRIQVLKTYWLGLCGRWTEPRSSLGVKVIVLRNCTVSVGSFAYSLVLLHRPLSPTLSLFLFLFLFLSLLFFLIFFWSFLPMLSSVMWAVK